MALLTWPMESMSPHWMGNVTKWAKSARFTRSFLRPRSRGPRCTQILAADSGLVDPDHVAGRVAERTVACDVADQFEAERIAVEREGDVLVVNGDEGVVDGDRHGSSLGQALSRRFLIPARLASFSTHAGRPVA